MTTFKSLCAPSVAFNSTSGRIEVSNDGRKVGRSVYKNWDKWNAEHRGKGTDNLGKIAKGRSAIAHEASQHANGGADPELEGTLAYQGRSLEDHFAKHPKMENSNYAMDAAHASQHGFANHFHQSAAEIHDQQAKTGKDNTRGMHERAAELHRIAAEAHRAAKNDATPERKPQKEASSPRETAGVNL